MLLFTVLTASAQPLITLQEDRSRYDLHTLNGGQWLPDWGPRIILQQQPGQDGPLNAGWSDEILHWQATLINESQDTEWYLIIRNPSLDVVRIYLDAENPNQFIQLSDYQTPAQRLFPGNHFIVPITVEADHRQTIYITATSEDWQFYPMMLVNQTGYQRFAQQEMLAIGSVTGLLLALFLFNLLQTLLKGHWSFVWVAVSAIAWALQLWFWYGLGYLWLWPHSPWLQNHIWYLLVPITGVSILGSVIASLTGFLGRSRKWRLYIVAIGGFVLLLPLQLMLDNRWYITLCWLWFAGTTLLVVYYFRPTRRLWVTQSVLLGYLLLSGLFFAYLSISPALHSAALLSLGLGYLTLTGLHSFAVYWQYHRTQQEMWRDLKDRSRTFEEVAGTQQEQLDQYRSAAQLSLTWRSTFTRNIAQRFEIIADAVQTLRQTVKAEARQSALNAAHRASRDGLLYVDDLLSLERLLTQDYVIESTGFDLALWLDQFDDWFEQGQSDHKVFFRVALLTPDLPRLRGPDQALRTVLLRLLDNALQYTDSGYVKLLVEAEGHARQRINCRFEVRDSGRGLTAEQVERIQRFWLDGLPIEVDGQRDSHQLGSGLTIALFLLRQLGARFDIQSTPEAGTSMSFWLWLDRDQETPAPAAAHWLIVDNNPLFYDEARQHLEGEVDVHWVRNGRIALSSLRDTQFDLIFIDLNTAIIDGAEFTRLCRGRDDDNRFAWIVGIQQEEDPKAALHAEQAGINEVVVMPDVQTPKNHTDFLHAESPDTNTSQTETSHRETILRAWFRELIRRQQGSSADPETPHDREA